MGQGMNKILPGLYVGSIRDSKDENQIRLNNITHVISIHDNPKRGVQEDVEYLCILASDKPNQNLVQFVPQCNDFIHSARLRDGNVLVHCLAGVSRSVTIAVAYVMSVTSLNWKDALKCVRAARAIANPNLGFQKQLQEFEGRRLREERRRLGLKFPRTIFLPDDETNVRQMIILYETMQALPEVDESASSIAERRCMSSPAGGGGPSTSGSVRGRGGGTAGSRPSSGGGPFDQLAPGRSPVMRRRTLPSPTKTPRGAKTI